jgi:GMP synthase-like glutamine amidotransferase
MRIHHFQHESFEGLGSIEPWIRARGHSLSETRFHLGEKLPELDSFDWLMVMGGTMSTRDEERFPWLREEKRFLARAIRHGKAVLGICLGSQLVAEALGARVHANPSREIGWFPVEFSPEARRTPLLRPLPTWLDVFHWHGDTFDLPPDAVHAARSAGCRHQAFLYGDRVVAMQFHPEMTFEGAGALVRHCPADLVEGRYIQATGKMLERPERFGVLAQVMSGLLDRMEALIAPLR